MSANPKDHAESTQCGPPVSGRDMRDALSRLQRSDTFSNSPKLLEFLDYVVMETIAGREKALVAKTIAHRLHGESTSDIIASASAVRVEARRLRRLLDDYYRAEGSGDPVRIRIDKGGYAPRFERNSALPGDGHGSARTRWRVAWLSAGSLLMLAIIAAVYFLGTDLLHRGALNSEEAKRRALLDKSPAVLEAENLTLQARGLIYPIFDAERQRLTTELFRVAIETDPNAAGAYAGAAQTLASLALLSIEGPEHDAYLSEARQMLERALELAPTDAWTQSAAGWVSYVSGDYADAMRFSERAASLAPQDGNVLDFYGVVAILCGEPQKGLAAGSRERRRTGTNTRFAFLNILAAANYHLGNYQEAAQAFEDGNARGGPLSAPGVVYLAATYEALGRTGDGKRLVDLLEKSWPAFPVEKVLHRLHRDKMTADEIIDRLKALGWMP